MAIQSTCCVNTAAVSSVILSKRHDDLSLHHCWCGPGAIRVSNLWSMSLQVICHLRFFSYNFLQKRHRVVQMVTLRQADKDLSIDMHIDLLRSPVGLKVT